MASFVLDSGKKTTNPFETWLDLSEKELKELRDNGGIPANVEAFLKEHKAKKAAAKKPATKKSSPKGKADGKAEDRAGQEADQSQGKQDDKTGAKVDQ